MSDTPPPPNTGGPVHPVTPTNRGGQCADTEYGMSIRTAIAMNVMAGFSQGKWTQKKFKTFADAEGITSAQARAEYAVWYADELITELTKNGGTL